MRQPGTTPRSWSGAWRRGGRVAWLILVAAGACTEPDPAPIDAAAPDAPRDDGRALDAAPTPDGSADAGPGDDGGPPDDADLPIDAAFDDAAAIDAAAIDATAIDAAAIDAPPAAAPLVTSVAFPPDPSGTIALTVGLRDDDSPAVALALAISCDAQQSWHPATVLDPVGALPAGPAGAASVLRWDSLADLDFHLPQTCFVRARATDPTGLAGPPLIVPAPSLDNLRAAARRADDYLIHYGPLTANVVAIAKTHALVILDPRSANLTRAKVDDLQRGVDPHDPADDVIVLCYVSVGEDIRTAAYTDAELLADPRFVGDGTGPRVDPRGPDGAGGPLEGLALLGAPSTGGDGYASFYLDDNDVYRDGVGDGRPDRNAHFGGAFVNAGDPAWFAALAAMTLDGPDGVAGLDEILTDHVGRGLGCDGTFLDTIDTAAPDHFTDLSSSNLSQFEWTAAGFQAFVWRLRQTYPRHVILQNRGLFFFDPRHPHFALSTSAFIDFAFFESFRLDSSAAHEWHPFFYFDNRYNVAPALMAEANRGRGFRVLSLGYAEGPPALMREETLTGGSTIGFASLLEDIRVAQTVTGFRHYLANSSLTRANTFVRDHASLDDFSPPAWTSTDNDHDHGYPTPPDAPTPRVGLQQLVAGPARLTLRWDVALDLHRVGYAAYVQDHPFDLTADPTLAQATRVVLAPRMGAGYRDGSGPGRYPYEADLIGAPGTTYYVLVRAFDELRNEEQNLRVLSAAPG